MPGVFVQSFGCRASQADGSGIEAAFEDQGYTPVSSADSADLIVVNTCTVTHGAEVDARRVIRNLHRQRPSAPILVTGCYAQRAPQDLAALEGVRWVVGNSHKSDLAQIALTPAEQYHGQILVGEIGSEKAFSAYPVRDIRESRTRPNVKVQDGCSNACSFCVIPSVRGRSRSAPLESVISQVLDLSTRFAEIVLTGINLGRWGRDLPGDLRFIDLLRAILQRTSMRRLRISSVEPMDWSTELLEFVAAEPRIAQHIHIPLQSGSDTVLKRMYRKYRTRHYATRVRLVRDLMPHGAIGADVMTGFPGETEEEFNESLRFIEDQPFTYLHVFTYSERPGTLAAERGASVPIPIRHERTTILRRLSEAKNRQFRQQMVGRALSAVTLEQSGLALSTNYLRVEMSHRREPNQIPNLEIAALTPSGLKEKSLLPVL